MQKEIPPRRHEAFLAIIMAQKYDRAGKTPDGTTTGAISFLNLHKWEEPYLSGLFSSHVA